MKTPIQLNVFEASRRRDEGIALAVDHADSNPVKWSDIAYNMLKEWLRPWPCGYRFQIEEFRQVAQIKGLPDPPNQRAFGSIAVRAKSEGLIKSNGQKATRGVTAHRAYANEWEKV